MIKALMKLKFRNTVLLLSLMLGACATPYKPFTAIKGGYAEKQLGEGVYEVTFKASVYTPQEQVKSHALLRSAEIAKANGYGYFLVKDTEDISSKPTHGPNVHQAQLQYNAIRLVVEFFAQKPNHTEPVYEVAAILKAGQAE